MEAICPSCGETFAAADTPEAPDLRCPRCGSWFAADEITSVVTSPAAATMDLTDASTVSVPAEGLPEIPGYRMLGFVARGGMGMLLKAHHVALDRPVAIKIPLPQYVGTPRDAERFLREARASARLRHPNICPIYAVEEHAGRPYIAMGFIEGENLRDFAKRERPTPHSAAQIVAVLARAVGYAHAHGVIHRDIKPSNVMIDSETGEPVLTDFGLAKELSHENVQVTRAGQLVGTPAYMAPEQAAGRAGEIGPRTDVYSLGAVLYELLCGRPPFLGTVGEILSRLQVDDVPPPRKLVPHLHRDLETICLKALSKDPVARYASAGALAEDLERFCAGETILARRAGLALRAYRKVRRRPMAAAAIAVGAVAVAAAVLMAVRASHTYKVAAVARTFETALDSKDWTVRRLEEAEATVAALEQLDAEQGRAARERLYARFADAIRESFMKPHLPPTEAAGIEKALDALASRSPGVVPALRKAFKDRLQRWVSVLDLAPPFAALESAFDRAAVKADAQGLQPAASGDAGRSPVVLTKVPGDGNTQLEVEFAPDWESAHELGLLLAASRDKGYAFIVRTGGPGAETADGLGPPAGSFAAAREARGSAVLVVLKDGVLLREDAILPDRLAAGPLRLAVSREEGRLTCQINDLPPVSAYDAFSMSGGGGVLGVQWPGGAHLVHLRASRQEIPVVASPLEQGDQMFSQGRFSEGLAFYRQQGVTAQSAEARQEARYKEGLCLLRLKRDAEAAPLFESLRAESGDVWPVVAACQLWALRLAQSRFEDVDAICDSLAARQYRFEQLAALAPEETRRRIVDFYWGLSQGMNFLRADSKRADRLARLIAFNRLLGVSDWRDFWPKFSLMRAYRMEGQAARALEVGAELIETAQLMQNDRQDTIIEDYGWVLTENQQREKALAMVERFLVDPQGKLVPRHYQLLIERARIRALMGQWGPAEKDLDEFFRLVAREACDYRAYSRACLMKGFMRRRQGDEPGALEAWRRGARPSARLLPNGELPEKRGGMNILQHQILAALSDEVTQDEVDVLLNQLAGAMRGLLPGLPAAERGQALVKQVLVGLLPVGVATLRDAWRRPRGTKVAEQIAFLDLSFANLVRVPAILVISETVRQMVFPDGGTQEQEQLVWDAMDRAYGAYFKGRIAEPELFAIFYTMKGQTNLTGWAGVAPQLEPSIRGPAAYVFGCLYLKRSAPVEAREFFKTAVTDAPAGSPLKRLAQAELDRMGSQ